MTQTNQINLNWSPQLAYAIGLLATDGSLSKDGRHIDLTSKDKEQLKNFTDCLCVNCKIGLKKSGSGNISFRAQLGDVNFYKFLLDIGLTPNKTFTIGVLKIPDKYFFDFIRGHFDGDGSFYSYFDPRWKSSFMYYMTLVSASLEHINWIRDKLKTLLSIKGHITKSKNSSVYQLKYGKKESLQLVPKMYYTKQVICLKRKLFKIEVALKNDANVAKLATALP